MGRYAEKDRIGTNRKPSHLHALVWNPGYFLRIVPGLKLVAIHPDGEHAKTFDFLGRLGKQGASFGRRPSAFNSIDVMPLRAPFDVPIHSKPPPSSPPTMCLRLDLV